MDIKNIDEVESLIQKYREVMAAKNKINDIIGPDGGENEEFGLTDASSHQLIYLPEMKADVLEAIEGVLNDRYDKIVKRLGEI